METSRGKKKEAAKGTKGFLWEKKGPSRHITREKNEKLSHLDTRLQRSPNL